MPASGSAAQLACVISHTLPFVRLAEDILESRAIPRKMDVSATREGELSQLAVRACLVALAATLGGCSTSEVTVQNWTPATVGGSSDATDLSRPNYRRIVADNINKIFPNSASLGDLEISQVRLVDHVKGPAWITCLKLHARVNPVVDQSAPNSTTTGDPVVAQSSGTPQYYAIFIQDDTIIDSRLGVAIDRCRNEPFQPFALSPPAAAKKN